MALLLLRISVAAILVLSAVNRLSNFSHLLAGAAVLVGVLLVIGLFTPVSSLATVVLSLTNLLIDGHPSNSVIIVVATAILESIALALLGPGAYSLDAKLFGRRVMVVPPPKDSN
ncbi:MAG TPA: hypothetical protein VKD70_17905 [Candidatus Acidoferrum sp.]|nr:hypothetical protein [Candidatus Acidoferrum sp.]